MASGAFRASAARQFLELSGWVDAAVAPIPSDASFRRYARVNGADGRRAMLMDADPATGEDVQPFLAVTTHLHVLGLSAPAVLATDPDRGFLLLEDLGDALFARIVGRTMPETTLYEAAVDLLVTLHSGGDQARPLPFPPYDTARLLDELTIFADWYLPAHHPDVPAHARDTFSAIWRGLLPLARVGSPVLVLRDYHAENLMWMAQRSGLQRVGLLDYQDAVVGSCAYDLVSLLEDARRDVDESLAAAMIGRYLAARPDIDAARFRRAYAVLGAQRNLKILGIFVRLDWRDGKPVYLGHLPRVRGYLARDLAHPALTPLRDWFGRWVPALARAGTAAT